VFVVDLFDEVEEQLRSERYKAMAAKVAPIVIGALVLALLVALGVWGWDSYRTKQTNTTSDAYVEALTLRDTNQAAQAEAAFKSISEKGPKAYRALALMQLGATALDRDDTKGAVALFDQAADLGVDPLIADAARLKSAFALMDTASYAETEGRLKTLAEEDRPYRSVAKEALAFAKLQNGDMAGARTDFTALTIALDSSEELRERARRVLQLIDAGTAKSLPQAAKAAIALPVQPVLPQFPVAGAAQ
jgi:hypothetical protein